MTTPGEEGNLTRLAAQPAAGKPLPAMRAYLDATPYDMPVQFRQSG